MAKVCEKKQKNRRGMFYYTNVYTKKNLDFALKEKVDRAKEVHKAFPGDEVIFGVFSKK